MADTYVNMGNVFQTQGDYEKALFYHQNALEIYKKSLGDCHASVATTEDNIGIVLMKMGDLQNALLRHQKALDIRTRCFGTGHVSRHQDEHRQRALEKGRSGHGKAVPQ